MTSKILSPEKIAEYREVVSFGPTLGVGGKALASILDSHEALRELERFRAAVMACRLLTDDGKQRGWNVSALTKLYNEQADAAPASFKVPGNVGDLRAAFAASAATKGSGEDAS